MLHGLGGRVANQTPWISVGNSVNGSQTPRISVGNGGGGEGAQSNTLDFCR